MFVVGRKVMKDNKVRGLSNCQKPEETKRDDQQRKTTMNKQFNYTFGNSLSTKDLHKLIVGMPTIKALFTVQAQGSSE
mgnify:CR=1 FL=1